MGAIEVYRNLHKDALLGVDTLKCVNDEIIEEYNMLLKTIDMMQIEFDCKEDTLTDFHQIKDKI